MTSIFRESPDDFTIVNDTICVQTTPDSISQIIFNNEFFETPITRVIGVLRYMSTSLIANKTVETYNGTNWNSRLAKVWNGNIWITVS